MSLPPDLPIDYALANTTQRPDVIFRVTWNDGQISRLTSTFGGLRLPADTIESVDQAYYAFLPILGTMPSLKPLLNGQSDSVEYGISGLSSAIADIADAEAELAEGAEVYVGKVYWDADWKMIGGARWVWLGAGGTTKTKRNGGSRSGDDFTPASYAISLEAGTQQIRRAGADLSYWSDPQQKRLHPTDEFFHRINRLSAGLNKAFPRF